MKQYTLAFIFDNNLEKVALIEVTKESWNKGKLNGIGGHIEPNESIINANIREVGEEFGMYIDRWKYFGKLNDNSNDWEVHLFTTKMDYTLDNYGELHNEEGIVRIYNIDDIVNTFDEKLMINLNWLIPMALNTFKCDQPFMKITEQL